MNKSELVVVKAGTAVVSNHNRTKLDFENITDIGHDIYQLGFGPNSISDVVLVSSGAVTAGIEKMNLRGNVLSRAEVDSDIRKKQVIAMIGDPLLTKVWSDSVGVPVASDLPTHNDLATEEHWKNLSSVIFKAISMSILPKFNEGDARSTEELEIKIKRKGKEFKRFADNDPLAAMLAENISKSAKETYQKTKLIYLTNMPGVLEDIEDKNSVISNLTVDEIDKYSDKLVDDSGISNGGMESKLISSKIALKGGVDEVIIGSGFGRNALFSLANSLSGTKITK